MIFFWSCLLWSKKNLNSCNGRIERILKWQLFQGDFNRWICWQGNDNNIQLIFSPIWSNRTSFELIHINFLIYLLFLHIWILKISIWINLLNGKMINFNIVFVFFGHYLYLCSFFYISLTTNKIKFNLGENKITRPNTVNNSK